MLSFFSIFVLFRFFQEIFFTPDETQKLTCRWFQNNISLSYDHWEISYTPPEKPNALVCTMSSQCLTARIPRRTVLEKGRKAEQWLKKWWRIHFTRWICFRCDEPSQRVYNFLLKSVPENDTIRLRAWSAAKISVFRDFKTKTVYMARVTRGYRESKQIDKDVFGWKL